MNDINNQLVDAFLNLGDDLHDRMLGSQEYKIRDNLWDRYRLLQVYMSYGGEFQASIKKKLKPCDLI